MGMVRVKFLSTLGSHQLLQSRRGFLLAAEGVLQLPGFERVGTSCSHSICLLYFMGIKNCPVLLKPFIGSHCNFGAFDQEQQTSESRTFFIVEKVLDIPVAYAQAPSPADSRFIKERALLYHKSTET